MAEPYTQITEDVPAGRREVLTAAGGFLAVLVLVVGASMLFVSSPMLLTLAPAAGVMAALSTRRWALAAGAAGAGVFVGIAATSIGSRLGSHSPSAWLLTAVVTAVVAAVIAAGLAFVRRSGGRVDRLLALVGLVVLIGAAWFVATKAVVAVDATGTSAASRLLAAPAIKKGYVDEQLYQNYVVKMADGESYYVAAGTTLSEANSTLPPGNRIGLDSAFAFRLPLMYWVMAKVARTGFALTVLTLVIGTMATIAAYLLARAYVGPAFALAGAGLVACLYAGTSEGIQLFHAETWAGAFALVAGACFVYAQRPGRAARALLWASAAAALVAALSRELAVVYVLLGLVATLATAEGRKSRGWVAWVVCLAAFAGAYVLHARSVAAVYPMLNAAQSSAPGHWFDPTLLGAAGAVNRIGEIMQLTIVPVGLLTALGVVGSIVAPRQWSERVFLVGATVGGVVVIALFHPSGDLVGGLPPSYWVQLIAPMTLACVPLAAALVAAWRDPRQTTGPGS